MERFWVWSILCLGFRPRHLVCSAGTPETARLEKGKDRKSPSLSRLSTMREKDVVVASGAHPGVFDRTNACGFEMLGIRGRQVKAPAIAFLAHSLAPVR
jgi:hypothetical protein